MRGDPSDLFRELEGLERLCFCNTLLSRGLLRVAPLLRRCSRICCLVRSSIDHSNLKDIYAKTRREALWRTFTLQQWRAAHPVLAGLELRSLLQRRLPPWGD